MVENSTRESLENMLAHMCFEKKINPQKMKISLESLPKEIDTLYFDGAYKRKVGKAVTRMVILDPFGEKLIERGFY